MGLASVQAMKRLKWWFLHFLWNARSLSFSTWKESSGQSGAALAGDSSLTWLGYLLTGLVVVGGSAGAVKLFQDVLGFRRTTRDQLKELAAVERLATLTEAEARAEKAKADIAGARAAMVRVTARSASPLTPGATPEQQILLARMAERDLKIARGSRRSK